MTAQLVMCASTAYCMEPTDELLPCRQRDGVHPGNHPRSRDEVGPGNLFVGCIPAGMDETGLRSLFEPSGQVADCHLVIDRTTGQHRGFGFVRMDHEQGALDAMQRLHNYTVRYHDFVAKSCIYRPAHSRAL